jgi:hypothetical protein
MPRTRKDCLLCGKKNLCKLSNHLADIHHLSSEERRIYLSDAKSFCADKEDYSIMHRSKRATMNNYDEGVSSSSQNGDIFESDDEKEHSSEEESSSEENENSEENDSKEESEEHESSEDGEDYDPWQTLIHEAKLQLLDKFQENVECLNNEGFSEVEAKRQSFSEVLPKLTKELEDIYVERLLWMSHMRKDPIHKKIMQTRDNLVDVDFLDREEALYSAVEKRKFLFKRLLEKRQHYSDDESDTIE